ncbi:hypothetical protein [Saccharospirillum salsuginis]|uniref:Uncharacterized protein n=1 Tax=Saccharospirillum salsuginis TaxID=418750 RepID=A0A918JZD3_9GAMM|nr:hypothetical protein [Saccharospirillum salsuginis]GGX39229.1 hypothetical protein GCM10007392_01960 [Saccharospirillum salsuginis]
MTETLQAEEPIEKEMDVALNSTNTLALTGDHIVGLAGNSEREPTGTLVVALEGQEHAPKTKIPMSNAQPLEHENPLFAGNRQLAIPGLNTAFQYRLHLEIDPNYLVPVHCEHGITGRPGASAEVFSAPTWFVPLLPRMYLDNELDVNREESLGTPSSGFLYIFIDGYLWREIGVQANEDQTNYQLKEINLDVCWGLNNRDVAIDLDDDAILVPQVINGKSLDDVRIAHSQVQWSWRQVEAMGGLHPTDNRVRNREQPIANQRRAKSQGLRTMTRLRNERTQPLTQLLPWFGDQVDHYRTEQDASHPNHHLPQFPLLNPLAIALRHTALCLEALKDLQTAYDEVRENNPHHASGEVIHRLIFDPTLWQMEGEEQWAALEQEMTEPFDGRFPHLYEYRAYLERQDPNWRQSNDINDKIRQYIAVSRWRRTRTYKRDDNGAEFLRDLRERLDERKLSRSLFPGKVKEAIATLDAARKRHFEWLDDKANGLRNRTRLGDQSIPLHSALADYANLDPDSDDNNWLEFLFVWLVLITPLHGRKTTISDLYGFMDTRRASAHLNPEDVGRQWIDQVLDQPSHPIHRMLFPSAQDIDITKPYYKPDDMPNSHFIGSGRFNTRDFARAVARAVAKGETQGAGPGPLSEEDSAEVADNVQNSDAAHSAVGAELFSKEQKELALPLRVLDDFFGWANDLLSADNPDSARGKQRMAIYVRLGQASLLPSLKGMHMVPKGGQVDTEKFVVLGANSVRQQQLASKAATQHRVDQFHAEAQGTGTYTDVYDGNTGQKIGSTLISQEMNWYKGVTPPTPGEAFDAHALWTKTGSDRGRGLTRITAEVDVIAVDKADYWGVEKAKLAAANDNIALGSDGHLYKGGIMGARGLNAVLSLIMLRYEAMTLMGIAGGSLNDRSTFQQQVALYTAVASLIAATGDASIATATLIGKDDVAKRLRQLSFGSWRRASGGVIDLRVFKTLGTIVSGVTSILTAVDAMEHYKRKDHDAAVALGLSAVTGGAMAVIGAGVLLKFGWAAAVPNPVVWALLAFSIGFAVLAHYWRDKPLPDWVSHGPYGEEAFEGTYAVWRDNPEDCYQALMSQLVMPALALEEGYDEKTSQDALIVTMTVPLFAPEADKLCIHTTVECWLARHEPGARYLSGSSHEDERFVKPYRIEQVHNEERTRIERIQYFYSMPEFTGNYNRMNVTFRSRGQIQAGDIVLPAPYKPGLYDDMPENTPVEVDEDQLNWVHTDSFAKTLSR